MWWITSCLTGIMLHNMLFSMKQKFQERLFFLRLLFYWDKLRAKYCIHLLGNCNNKETIRQDFGSFFVQGEITIEMKIIFPTYFSLFFTYNSLFLLLHVRLGMAWLDSCA